MFVTFVGTSVKLACTNVVCDDGCVGEHEKHEERISEGEFVCFYGFYEVIGSVAKNLAVLPNQ